MKQYMHDRTLTQTMASLALSIAMLAASTALADGIPTTDPLRYSGTLYVDGRPLNGSAVVELSLYSSGSAGSTVCSPIQRNINVRDGAFSVALSSECVNAVRSIQDVWLQLTVTPPGQALVTLPIEKLSASPYAVEAQRATTAGNALTAAAAQPGSTLSTRLQSIESNVTNLLQPPARKVRIKYRAIGVQTSGSGSRSGLVLSDLEFDTTMGAVSNTGGGFRFTAPATGHYAVNLGCMVAQEAGGPPFRVDCGLRRDNCNTGERLALAQRGNGSEAVKWGSMNVNTVIHLAAGEALVACHLTPPGSGINANSQITIIEL